MKQQLIKLSLITFLTSTGFLSATPIITLGEVKERPVDEGEKNTPKEDKIKGATTVGNQFKSQVISLAKEQDTIYQIVIKKVSQAPITCKLIRNDKELESVSKKQRHNLVFDIDTTQLKVDDNITLINKNDTAILEILVKE